MANPNLAPFDLDPSNVCITCKDAYNKTIRKTKELCAPRNSEVYNSSCFKILSNNFRVAIENWRGGKLSFLNLIFFLKFLWIAIPFCKSDDVFNYVIMNVLTKVSWSLHHFRFFGRRTRVPAPRWCSSYWHRSACCWRMGLLPGGCLC